ncbi:MAG: AAA domain-containing protein, partial [Elusimicrobiota bacterium]
MAGDHKQLPPTILNKKAGYEGLADTMFERLIALHGEEIKSLLRVQYRMHEKIMRFSSEEFYNSKLIADDSVKKHNLAGLMEIKKIKKEFKHILDPWFLVALVDTEGKMPERIRSGSTSKENPKEANLAAAFASEYVEAGLKTGDIGIITPYKDQKDLIKSRIPYKHLE